MSVVVDDKGLMVMLILQLLIQILKMLMIIKRKPVVFISLLIKALTMLMMPKFIGPTIRVL